MLDKNVQSAAEQAAQRVAGWYSRRVFWADPDDLLQEARYWALRSLTSGAYDPATGVSMVAYAASAATKRLHEWCWRNTAPVHEVEGRFRDLRNVHRVSFDTPASPGKPGTIADTLVSPAPSPEDALLTQEEPNENELAALVREQVSYLLSKKGGEFQEIALTLLDEDPKTPKEIAAERGITERRVYRIREKAKEMFAENALLYTYWKESNA